MILCFNGVDWREEKSLFQALGLKRKRQEVISVVGGGGKTTFLKRLQKEYREKNIMHVLSTTTHMNYELGESFLGEESPESFFRVFNRCGTVTAGSPISENKMRAPTEKFLSMLMMHKVTLLLEADGAKHMPFKVPAEHEPVVREDTTLLISVYGLDALEKKISDTAFRPWDVALFIGKHIEDSLCMEDYKKVACSEYGGRKGKPEKCRHVVVLNKADCCKDLGKVRCMAEKMTTEGTDTVLITSDLWR